MNPNDVPTRVEIQDWLESQLPLPFKCYLTGDDIIKSLIEADHKQPVSREGTFKLENIGLTSKQLNAAKGNMTEKEFRQLLSFIGKWEDEGKGVLARLRTSNLMYRRG